MTRMKKYVAAASVVAAMVGVPTMAHAFAAPAKAPVTTSALTKAAKLPGAVRVVAPGERVHAAPGVQLWLTRDGKHWSTPELADQFRSVTDGNIDRSRAAVSVQAEPVGGRYFLSGIYTGKGDAAGVKVVTDQGTVTGTVVRLAGHPGWGVWYATIKLPTPATANGLKNTPPMIKGPQARSFLHSLTVFDAAGHTIATLTLR